jgi:hypothetical protein
MTMELCLSKCDNDKKAMFITLQRQDIFNTLQRQDICNVPDLATICLMY